MEKELLPTKVFYRVSNEATQQGLWYNSDGTFTGLIHDKFNFCKNSTLAMDYDETLCGYLSATDDLEGLFQWFTKEDIIALQEHGWFLHKYESDDYWFYDRFQHFVVKQDTLKVIEKIILTH